MALVQRNIEDLLVELATTQIRDRRPRRVSGQISVEKEKHVMVVGRYESLSSVFRKFAKEGYLSAPVRDGRRYIGIISMLDLVQFVRSMFFGITEAAWCDFWDKEERFKDATVDDILKLPDEWDRDPFVPITNEFSRFHVLESLVRKGQKQIAVINPETDRINNFETESRLVAFLGQRLDMLGPLRNRTVSTFMADLKPVLHTVLETDKAINAFNLMCIHKVSGLAVVNEDGTLVNSISIRDLRGVGTGGESFFRLFKTVGEFKRHVVSMYPKMGPLDSQRWKWTPSSALYVTPSSTLADVIQIMHEKLVHRVFICTEDSVAMDAPIPTGVISQHDVLSIVLDAVTGTI